MGASFDKVAMGSYLRQAQARLNIYRGKKLGKIAKTKDDICKHLEAGNEVNAKIWCETLINEENQIPVYDVISTMCDQVNGRLTQIEKFGPPKDMNQTFATLIHAAPKLDVQELMQATKQLNLVLEKSFIKEAHTNYNLLNPLVAEKIDFKTPEPGEVVYKLCQLATERNINYMPTSQSNKECVEYCGRKGIPFPPQCQEVPSYAPVPQPLVADLNAQQNMPVQPVPYQPPVVQPPPPIYNPHPQEPMYPTPPAQQQPQPMYPPPPQPQDFGAIPNPPMMVPQSNEVQRPPTAYDWNKQPDNQPQPPINQSSDLDDYQARLDALKGMK